MSYSLAFSKAVLTIIFIADKISFGIYDFVPTREISKSLSIPAPTLVNILQSLNKAGIIETREGNKGGVRLAVKTSDLTIYDIFKALEADKPLFRLDFNISATGDRPARAQETIKQSFITAQQAMEQSLSKTTLKDIIKKIGQK